MRPTFLVIAITSFGLSCLWAFIDPSGNFYLPHTRAWELLCGALLEIGLVPQVRSRIACEAAAVAGLVLMVSPLILLNRESPFPAWNAAPVVLGTAMLIHTGGERTTVVARLLSSPLPVSVGLISYSLYLFHWPIIVFWKYQLLRDPATPELLAMAVTSICAAWVSWRFVESPFRDRKRVSRTSIFSLSSAAATTAAMLGIITFYMDGFPARMGNEAGIAQRDDPQDAMTAHCFVRDWRDWAGDACYLTRGGGPTILLWGDSHAYHYVPAILQNPTRFDTNILVYTSGGCAPVLGTPDSGPMIGVSSRGWRRANCQTNNDHIFDIIRDFGVERVVLSADWGYGYFRNGGTWELFEHSLKTVRDTGVEVYVIGDNPDFPFKNPAFLGVRLARRDDPAQPYFARVRNDWRLNARMAALVGAEHFYNPMDLLCRSKECLAYENGKLLMYDNAHFSTYGATKTLSDVTLQRFFSVDSVDSSHRMGATAEISTPRAAVPDLR